MRTFRAPGRDFYAQDGKSGGYSGVSRGDIFAFSRRTSGKFQKINFQVAFSVKSAEIPFFMT